ncbi:hypothetical protein BH23ACT3_BH23ACT3_02960 [soil metagenome]
MFLAVQVVLLVAIVLVPPGDDWPTPGWLLLLASVLTFGGMVVVVLAALRLGRALTATAGPRGDAPLQTNGMYRWVRHPLYAGLLALVMGVALRSGNVLAALLAAVIVVFFHRKATWEEEHLRQRSPAYDAYASVTPRFFPRPRSSRTRR